MKKGDVLAVARVAGIMSVKNTSNLIPLAHNCVAVEGCVVDIELDEPETVKDGSIAQDTNPHGSIHISVTVQSSGKTGVEMEALAGVMGAALTVVDMCKGVDRGCIVEDVRVAGKKGGRSGAWGLLAGEEEGMKMEKVGDKGIGEGGS